MRERMGAIGPVAALAGLLGVFWAAGTAVLGGAGPLDRGFDAELGSGRDRTCASCGGRDAVGPAPVQHGPTL